MSSKGWLYWIKENSFQNIKKKKRKSKFSDQQLKILTPKIYYFRFKKKKTKTEFFGLLGETKDF